MRVSPFVFRLLYRARSMYWRIVRPTTYGVKALIVHPADSDRALLVRHSYGNQALWSLPGGGYKPARETPEQAARRECIEELGIETEPSALVLEASRNGEISEARWVAVDLSDLPDNAAVSRWVHSALQAHTKA